MFKNAEVVMIPTDEKSNLFIKKINWQGHEIINSSLEFSNSSVYLKIIKVGNDAKVAGNSQSFYQFYNLIVYLPQQIKEGFKGWAIAQSIKDTSCIYLEKIDLTERYQCYYHESNLKFNLKDWNIYPVIASSLSLITKDNWLHEIGKEYLPCPSQGFIEKYVEKYNEGNPIKDILVEYNEEHLKVSRKNEITIRKVDNKQSSKLSNSKEISEFMMELIQEINKVKSNNGNHSINSLIENIQNKCQSFDFLSDEDKFKISRVSLLSLCS